MSDHAGIHWAGPDVFRTSHRTKVSGAAAVGPATCIWDPGPSDLDGAGGGYREELLGLPEALNTSRMASL